MLAISDIITENCIRLEGGGGGKVGPRRDTFRPLNNQIKLHFFVFPPPLCIPPFFSLNYFQVDNFFYIRFLNYPFDNSPSLTFFFISVIFLLELKPISFVLFDYFRVNFFRNRIIELEPYCSCIDLPESYNRIKVNKKNNNKKIKT